ncbi:LOW QUALITY PROTEIN: hypothetical protein RJ639_036903 [Escallonia herrerae]|uniref:Uncharacterized protein n=1 Tax=Escallonia herrerae TaxID=1293975 RepID=A0AA88WQH3_9ASTE|nr:LOW QUALITY PROTEIN: hypothetical protein RJ639_036903 [Escallonia herrerae]
MSVREVRSSFQSRSWEILKMKNKILSDCTKSSYALRPTRGNALLFFNLHPNTTPDQSSSHARCPVLDGDMWFATKFFHPVMSKQSSSKQMIVIALMERKLSTVGCYWRVSKESHLHDWFS